MYSDQFVAQSPTVGIYTDWPRRALAKPYAFRVLGRFEGHDSKGGSIQLDSGKVNQTLAYLLVRNDSPHQREALAQSLWSSLPRNQARKQLRQTLWLMQSRILQDTGAHVALLIKEKDWLQVNVDAVWLDVLEVGRTFELVHGTPGEHMSEDQTAAVRAAVALYRGDLLEGWTDHWCVTERERIRVMHLAMLEKLLAHCEARGDSEEGLVVGERLLRLDRAHERAHRRLMRLSYRAGDRTGALRQYERCCVALLQELGVRPSEETRNLYEQMRLGASADLIGAPGTRRHLRSGP